VLRRTLGLFTSQTNSTYGTLTHSGRPFQQRSACRLVSYSSTGLLPSQNSRQPHVRSDSSLLSRTWFRLFPFRSPLLREYSLFLRVLRCFSSPGSLLRAYVFSTGSSGITLMGLPHSDILGSLPTRGSPRPFAAWSRPSSAPDAKASTVCPSRESTQLLPVPQNQHSTMWLTSPCSHMSAQSPQCCNQVNQTPTWACHLHTPTHINLREPDLPYRYS
jgi:hypothetical protein